MAKRTALDFHTELDRWEHLAQGSTTSDPELAAFMYAAKNASGVSRADWSRFHKALTEHAGLKAAEVASRVRTAKICSSLSGNYPESIGHFIELFLHSRGVKVKFNGMMESTILPDKTPDENYIFNEMCMWQTDVAPLYKSDIIRKALDNYLVNCRLAVLDTHYQVVKHSKNADPSLLEDFVKFLLKDYETPEKTVAMRKATVIALRSFIYRVKNHMRGVPKNSGHIMPVLFGKQGSGKTAAITTLLTPIADCYQIVGFDFLSDNSRQFELSTMPVMVLDEMAGLASADVQKLKSIMNNDTRLLRQMYGKATSKWIVTTFIGATDKDMFNLLRDETGSRRFLQAEVKVVPRADVEAFAGVMREIWQSVDENALRPPEYETSEVIAFMQSVQGEQSHAGIVKEWLDGSAAFPTDTKHYQDLYVSFAEWGKQCFESETRFMNASKFKSELLRLRGEANYRDRIIYTIPQNRPHFKIVPIARTEEELGARIVGFPKVKNG